MLISWDEEIVIETWHRGTDRLFGLRDFRIMNGKQQTIGIASTSWLILDANSRRPLKVSEIFNFNLNVASVFSSNLQKIVISEQMDHWTTRRVNYSDLDVVGHVNNVKYLEWCIDALENEVLMIHEIGEIEINYINEANAGEEIEILGSRESDGEIRFLARSADTLKEVFRARLILN